MAMSKASLTIQNRSSDSVTGAGIVATDTQGAPSENTGAKVQSPSSLHQPKMPSVVLTATGSEKTASN